MERRTFNTPLGEVWLWGRPEAFDTDAATVLGVTGTYAHPTTMRDLPDLVGGPVLVADLPGNRCPRLAAQSVGAYVTAFSDVVRQLERPVVPFGTSLGATVALGIRGARVRERLAIEPLLDARNADTLWPELRRGLEARAPDDPERDFLWSVFGLAEDRVEPRSYLAVLDGLPEGAVIAVGQPDGGDAGEALPSFVTDAERRRLKALPAVRLVTLVGMGHKLKREVAGWAAKALEELLRRVGERP